MIICVTGKSGSGKTTVCRMLKEKLKGAKVIDADKIGQSLLSNKSIKTKLVKQFGTIILTNGTVDRKNLANMAFLNESNLKKLNDISHPLLIKKLKAQIDKKKTNIIDAALFKELKLGRLADIVILIKISEITAANRLKQEVCKRRLYQEEPKKSDFIVYNNSSISALRQRIYPVAESLKQQSNK